ncbi:hypothetical protein GGF37_001153, partial [Kickxella alabastrina]
NCQYACEYPGTEGTTIEYNWNLGSLPSAGYIACNPQNRMLVAFQGTKNATQWVDSIDDMQASWP